MRRQRDGFDIPEGVRYLNCAYMSPLHREVEEAGLSALRKKRRPWTISATDFFEDSDRLRAAYASLIGSDEPDRVAIIPSVSYGISTAARNLDPPAGSRIVVLAEQFPSNVYPWHRLAADRDLSLSTVAPPDTRGSRGESWNAALLEAIDRSTSVVAVPHFHWMDGTRFDLVEVGRRCREVGAALVVDGTQSVGAVPFDVRAVRPDALVCAGYKWLLGPYGVALAYFGERFDDGVPLEETWIAREGSEDFRGLVEYEARYKPGAVRFDVGERADFIHVPMMVAALEQILAWRPERILARCEALLRPLADGARSRGWPVEDDAWRGGNILGLGLPPGHDLAALGARLERARVYASLRGGSLRVSPHVYNDEADAAALASVVFEG